MSGAWPSRPARQGGVDGAPTVLAGATGAARTMTIRSTAFTMPLCQTMAPSPVIHLVDDDASMRADMAFALTAAGHAVRTYDSATAFLSALPGLQPGCIIIDIHMPGIDGLELQRRLTVLQIDLPVIIITGHAPVQLAVQAMKAGAVDVLQKPFAADTLCIAIQAALERYERTSRQAAERQATQVRLATLSPRERAVLRGLLAGLPNKTIAHTLQLSARTVEVHRAKLMTKMGACSLLELVRMALIADPSG